MFLALFADCVGRCDARELLRVYVKGQLSNLHRKTAEAIALRFKTPPRTLQHFLESIKWKDENAFPTRRHCLVVARNVLTEEVTQLSHLFCARMRQEFDQSREDQVDRISVEQVRSAMNVWLDVADLPPSVERKRFQDESEKQQYDQRRNQQARKSHTKTRVQRLAKLGIDVNRVKSCLHDSEKT